MSEEAKSKLLPGMAAIAVWMFLLALGGLVGVTMHRLPIAALILCAAFAAAGNGLLAKRRWGWAMTLSAVLLSATCALWVTVKFHQPTQLWFALVNTVFFLYLARPEVRARLR